MHPNQTTRFTAPVMLFSVNSAYALAAPFLPAGETGGQRFNLVWDWVGGITLSPGTVDLRAGYVGSQGCYTNVDERTSALFRRSILQAPRTPQAIAALPYLAVGVQRLPWPEDLETRIGRTRIFGRQLRWYTLEPRTEPAPDDADTGTGGGFDLRTVHVDQMGLFAGLVDLRFTAAARPSPLVHEALLGIHTRGYDGFEASERTGGAGLWLGMVQMPAARHYHVAPGPKPTLVVDVGAPIGDKYEARGYGHIGLRINHADLLDIHPYAVGAPQLFIEYLQSDKTY